MPRPKKREDSQENVRQRWIASLFVRHADAPLTVQAISDHTGFDPQTVEATLNELRELGYLTCQDGGQTCEATDKAREQFAPEAGQSVVFTVPAQAQAHGQAEFRRTGVPQHLYHPSTTRRYVAAPDAAQAARLLGVEEGDVILSLAMTDQGEYDLLQTPFTQRRVARLRATEEFASSERELDLALFRDGTYRLLLPQGKHVEVMTPERVILSQVGDSGVSITIVSEPNARRYLGLPQIEGEEE